MCYQCNTLGNLYSYKNVGVERHDFTSTKTCHFLLRVLFVKWNGLHTIPNKTYKIYFLPLMPWSTPNYIYICIYRHYIYIYIRISSSSFRPSSFVYFNQFLSLKILFIHMPFLNAALHQYMEFCDIIYYSICVTIIEVVYLSNNNRSCLSV